MGERIPLPAPAADRPGPGRRASVRARLARRWPALAADRSGATTVEFAFVAGILFTLAFGALEFGTAFAQYNAASKALASGVRRAAVSNPVAADLRTLDNIASGEPGAPMPNFERRCSGATRSCSGGAFDVAAFNALLYGPGNTTCPAAVQAVPPMCAIHPSLRPENVEIDYVQTGLGFSGRPGGPVPTITLRLTNLTFDFVVLNRLLGLPRLTMTGLTATATGEDLSS